MSSFGFYRPRCATIALILLATGVPPATLLAQETAAPPPASEGSTQPPQDAIGPPQLRGFDLQGSKDLPGRPQATPQPAPPTVTIPPPKAVVPVITPEPALPKAEPPKAEPPVQPSVPRQPRVDAVPPPGEAQAPLLPPTEAGPAPAPLPQPEEPAPAGFAFSWIYLAAVAAAAVMLGLFLYRRRRNVEDRLAYQIVDSSPEPAPEPAPLPIQPELLLGREAKIPDRVEEDPPAFLVRSTADKPKEQPTQPAPGEPVQSGLVGIQIRPWLQLEFRPDRATTTPTEAAVQFELVIANTGNAVASNVRLDARMFNAGPQLEQEIEAYFAAPVADQSGGVIPAIAPRSAASMRSVVAIPKEHVREIEVQGRRLFIPTVAITVAYEWGNGKTGRTSMSFLVGREPENPSSKMSPLRLDQGPRIYRQLGQRQSQPAVLV